MIANVKLLEKVDIARDTAAFYFEKPEGFMFRAGQFADYTLIDPPETDTEGNTRGFSLITAPYENLIGAATRLRDTAYKRVLRELPIGTELKLDAPYGDFTLHKTESTPAVFVIGGIGITPVISMIKQAAYDKTSHQITVIHASHAPYDIPFLLDLRQIALENTNITYVPVVSADAPDDWQGESGHIDEAIIHKYVLDISRPIYYLSGPEGLVKAVRELLVEIGANEDNIKTEEFAGY